MIVTEIVIVKIFVHLKKDVHIKLGLKILVITK